MKNLSIINPKNTITSLEIASITGKQHSNVMRDIRNIVSQIQDINQFNFELVEYRDTKGELRPMYNLTKKDCLLLASGYDANLRAKIILRWEELELKNSNFEIPQTFSQALLLAARQAEEIEQQKKLLKEQKPKVDFYNEVASSKDTCDMNTVAKVLNCGLGRNRLFAFLRSKGILLSNNQPSQVYIELCWFRIIETKYSMPNGDVKVYFKTVVYQKGIDGIRKLLKNK